jgi:hypothetical protein
MRPDLGRELTHRDGLEHPTVRRDGLLLEAARPGGRIPMSRRLLPEPCEDRNDIVRRRRPGRGRHAIAAQAAPFCRHPALPDERKEQLVDGIPRESQNAGKLARFHVVGPTAFQLDQGFKGFSLALIENC